MSRIHSYNLFESSASRIIQIRLQMVKRRPKNHLVLSADLGLLSGYVPIRLT